MAARQPFWKWCHWKSIGFYSYTQVLRNWSLELIFKGNVKLQTGNQKNPIWPPDDHSENYVAQDQKVSAYDQNQHAYEIQNWNSIANLTYALETMLSTDGRTNKVNPVYPPPTLLGRGMTIPPFIHKQKSSNTLSGLIHLSGGKGNLITQLT